MIEVELPDGTIVEFPEGTDQQTITNVLRAQVPTEKVVPEGVFKKPSDEDMAVVEENMPRFNPEATYTPTTVLSDRAAVGSIRDYMSSFHGIAPDTSDEEVVDQYLAKMRKFSAGQSVVTLDELLQLRKADKEKLQVAGRAYDIFDRFEGVFSDDYTWGETFDGLGTYMRAVVVDPTNLVGLGLGKLIAGSSTKAGSVALKTIAQEAAEQSLKATLTKRLGETGAKKVLAEGAATAPQRAALGAAQQAARLAEREAMTRAASTAAVSTALKSQAKKEIAVAAGVDTALALGVDYAYQQGMMLTGRQEEWSAFQSGLTALGGLGGGMLAAGLQLSNRAIGKQTAGILDAYNGYDFARTPARNAAQKLEKSDLLKNLEANFTKFSDRVAAGRSLTEEGDLLRGVNEQEFFRFLVLGNEELGVKGLAQTMIEAGVKPPTQRYVGDNITSFMADTLVELAPEQKDQFVKLFREKVGKHIPNYADASMEDIANLMSYQTSVAGQQLQVFSQVAKMFKTVKIDPETGTIEDALDILNPAVAKPKGEATELEVTPRSIDFYQSTLIQTIVTHPGTTALNIKGSVVRGLFDTTSDMVQATMYTAAGLRGLVKGDATEVMKGIKMLKASGTRFSRMLAPDATAKEVDDYLAIRPNAEKALYRFLSGGVDNTDILKQFDMDKAQGWNKALAQGLTNYKDFAQKLYLTQLQDKFFKTQNFMYYLDKRLAQTYGKNYNEFMSQANVTELMGTQDYAAIELKAVEDTLLSVFSKSYSSRETFVENPVHALATMIESFRNVRIVGAALPFGQFFNGTVDFMADYSGAKLLYRLAGAGEGRSMEALTESASKAAVGVGAVLALSLQEEKYIEAGLGWKESLEEDGTVISKEYDFPESFFKMVARGVAHLRRDGSVPEELQAQFAGTFGLGAFTRNISGAAEEFTKAFSEFAEGDIIKGLGAIVEVGATEVGAAWISGYTRPLDPVNQLSGLAREDGTLVLDRNQGVKVLNESFRYVDQIFGDVLLSLGSEEKRTATMEEPLGEIGKMFGYRTVPAQSNTQKMMNGIEKPYWKADFRTNNEALNNRLNELIFKHIEPQATLLVNGKRWNTMSVDQKEKSVAQAWELARKKAKEELSMSPLVEDAKLSAINEVISKADSQKAIDKAMEYLGMEGDLGDYNSAQIRSLLFTLERIKEEDLLAPYQ